MKRRRKPLTPAWHDLRKHKEQEQAWWSKHRFKILACGRGSGKSMLAKRFISRALPVEHPCPRPMYFYALPTYAQAKRVAWKSLKELIPKRWIVGRPKEGELIIETIFGSELHVVGLDRPERIEGNQWAGCVIDESCDIHPDAFNLSVLPALSEWSGWCWRIGVPKRVGQGAAVYKKAFFTPDPDTLQLTWKSSTILTPEKLKYAKGSLTAEDYAEQYDASWESAKGAIFYAFDETLNTNPNSVYYPNKPIYVGSDFNVNPMSWVLAHKFGDTLHVFDEVWIRNTNTPKTLDALHRRYPLHTAGWGFFGDASSKARKTSASQSDYLHIVNDTRFVNKRVIYPSANPAVNDRFATSNALMCNGLGVRRLFVNPKCVKLIEDLNTRAWKPGIMTPNDKGDTGHISDALGYLIWAVFPLPVNAHEATPAVHLESY